ncbi:MAG: phosphorylase family protein [Rhodospirillales bacterium]
MARKPAAAPASAVPASVVGFVGVVAGLASEVRALRLVRGAPDLTAHVSAADPVRAEGCARDLLARGAKGLISFGIAGGLAPGPRTGDLVLAHWVRDHESGDIHPCNAEWVHDLRAALAHRGPRLRLWEGGLMGAGAVTGAPAVKALLHKASGAFAVDMESAAVARVAAEAGAPFAAVRAISDPRDRAVPAWLTNCIDDAGRAQPGRVLSLLRQNRGDIPAVLRAAADSARAHKSLRQAARLMGPALRRG